MSFYEFFKAILALRIQQLRTQWDSKWVKDRSRARPYRNSSVLKRSSGIRKVSQEPLETTKDIWGTQQAFKKSLGIPWES